MVTLRSMSEIVLSASEERLTKLVVVESTYPMDLVCMDFLFLEMSAGGYEHILVITDRFTRYAQAIHRRKQQPESYLITLSCLSVITVFPLAFTVTNVATSKAKLLRSCVPLPALISRGPLLITPWATECQTVQSQMLLSMLGTLEED